jgi:ribosomal protein S27AE
LSAKNLDTFVEIHKSASTAVALVPQQPSDGAVRTLTPTEEVYGSLQTAYTHFNHTLFGGKLPECLIALEPGRQYGYFAADRIVAIGGKALIDKIALNPTQFAVRTPKETLSTLVHEMVHCEQQHFGKPSPHGYHNLQWVAGMRRVGLEPSSTGKPGGKPTGHTVSHYIIEGGPFDLTSKAFEATGLTIGWGDVPIQVRAPAKPKREDFDCPQCGQQTAQATPKSRIKCGDCDAMMVIRPRATEGL